MLATASPPKTILVVCHGNICRSPYLQAVLQRLLPATTVTSAGFLSSGRRIPEVSLTIVARRGFDLTEFKSRAISADLVNAADVIIVMDVNQSRGIRARFHVPPSRVVIAGDLDPRFDETRAIRDPWSATEDVFEAAFDRLDRCAATFVTALADTPTNCVAESPQSLASSILP
jgi:protein-tyrosine phosphatase